MRQARRKLEPAGAETSVHVSLHAAQRWIERIDPRLDIVGAKAAILQHRDIIELGIRMKACAVILGTGTRLIIQNDTIVTIIPKG